MLYQLSYRGSFARSLRTHIASRRRLHVCQWWAPAADPFRNDRMCKTDACTRLRIQILRGAETQHAAVAWHIEQKIQQQHEQHDDPGRTRTCNLWFRKPTPYPLGHRAACVLHVHFAPEHAKRPDVVATEFARTLLFRDPNSARCVELAV
jgi:hypothetical protein